MRELAGVDGETHAWKANEVAMRGEGPGAGAGTGYSGLQLDIEPNKYGKMKNDKS